MEAAPQRRPSALEIAKRVLRHEAEALLGIASGLGEDFSRALEALARCQGAIVVTGMGKAGLVGQKISATLCSTGAKSFFLHPAEAIHGDLGRVSSKDVVLALSMSGETEELVRVLPPLSQLTQEMVAITGRRDSTLGKHSQVVLALTGITEAGANGLAPSSSTTAMLALGDALALALCEGRGFRPADFARFHPGGSLGRKLAKVTELMRPLADCRIADSQDSVRDTFVAGCRAPRRSGAVMIVDAAKRLAGVFTDSDLARLLQQPDGNALLEVAVGTVMTADPITVSADARMEEAIAILGENQISELPVVDSEKRPLGLIDITDIIRFVPATQDEQAPVLLPFPREDP